LKLVYKQRNARANDFSFGLGPSWECNRLSYFRQEGAWNDATHFVPGGGIRIYPAELEYKSDGTASFGRDLSGWITNASVGFSDGKATEFNHVNQYYSALRHHQFQTHRDHQRPLGRALL